VRYTPLINILLFVQFYSCIAMNNALITATKEGKIDICLDLLLQPQSNVNCVDKEGNTLLHLVSECKIAQFFLRAGADVNKENKLKETPLIMQVQCGNYEMVSFLLQHGAQPNMTDKLGNTALHALSTHNVCNEKILDALVNAGADLTLVNNRGESVFEALDFSRPSCVEPFAKYGYCVFTPWAGYDQNLYDLLKKNAHNLKNCIKDGLINGPKMVLYQFFKAIYQWDQIRDAKIKQQEVAKFIDHKGLYFRYPSREKVEDMFGKETMAYAKRVMKTLILGDILFEVLKIYGHKEVKAVCAGRSLMESDHIFFEYSLKDCRIALAEKLELKLFRLPKKEHQLRRLLESGVDINCKNNKGETALMVAAQKDFCVQSAKLLLKVGEADHQIVDKAGHRALWHAICAKNFFLVELLLLKYKVPVHVSEVQQAEANAVYAKVFGLDYDTEERMAQMLKEAYNKQEQSIKITTL
jgi:ankyrin repeat protein